MPESLVIESPFRNVGSFEMREDSARPLMSLASPFVEALAYEGDEGTTGDAAAGVRRTLLAELHDEELDDAIYELVGELAANADGVAPELRSYTLNAAAAPLIAEIEAFIQGAAEALGARDARSLTESEIDATLSQIGSSRAVSPEFERLFGGLKKAIQRAAKGAASLAKQGIGAALTLGLGPVLNKLKGLVRPLIERVLRSAINRLPPPLRPAATALAGHLPRLFQSESDPNTDELAFDIGGIQSEFHERVADLFLVDPETALDEELGARESREDGLYNGADVTAARERFVADLERLEDGEDASPAVERFIPALLPAVKLALKLAGRKRVVRLLSGLVAKLIGRFVGPTQTAALSSAIVDSGLLALGLEISANDQRRTAHQAIASTVEETVRRAVALPDATLDNETLLEGSIVRAFEAAAAANLPAVLPEQVYRQRPDLAETDARQAAWIPWPVRGRTCVKKFGQIIRTRITPHTALAVTTFGAVPLAHFLQEELGLEAGEGTEADVHVYEAIAGTNLAEVAQLEGDAGGAAQFHPLTHEAAALLLREPGLARPNAVAGAARNLGIGQRVFRIALPGHRRPGMQPGARRRRSGLYTVLDFRADRIKLYLHLSERRAQELASSLRKQAHVGTLATSLKAIVDRGLAAATAGTGKIRLVHEALALPEALGGALARVPQSAARAFMSRLGEWAVSALTDFLSKQSTQFIATTEDVKDGVTLVITLGGPPGLATLRKALAGTAVANGGASLAGRPASVEVRVVAGFTNG